MYGNGMGAYKQTGVVTADPKRLVLMCYEEAIRSLKIARTKYLSRDYEEKAEALRKVQDIINALNSALDYTQGGEIASNLHALYHFMLHQLMEADLKRDMKGIDHIIWMLTELKSAWEEILNGNSTHITSDLRHIAEKEPLHVREMRVSI
jgi:flagellar secretion chaperone FliS